MDSPDSLGQQWRGRDYLHFRREVYRLGLDGVGDQELLNGAGVKAFHAAAGEQAVLKLPSGRKYSIWGWPDLRRDGSKVIAVGWGDPLAEVIPLHRYPVKTGTCIEDPWGLLPTQNESVEEICEAIVGQAPKDTSGVLFAIQGDAVWIQRGYTVFRWDGRREINDGMPKQVLASLTLHWSNR